MAHLGICQGLRTPKILEIAGDMGGVSIKGSFGVVLRSSLPTVAWHGA